MGKAPTAESHWPLFSHPHPGAHPAYSHPFVPSMLIFNVYEILFAIMGSVANLDELKFELKQELRQEILTEVLDIIRDEFYPPEENIRKEFIQKVEETERRVKEGKFSKYTPEEFEKRFL